MCGDARRLREEIPRGSRKIVRRKAKLMSVHNRDNVSSARHKRAHAFVSEGTCVSACMRAGMKPHLANSSLWIHVRLKTDLTLTVPWHIYKQSFQKLEITILLYIINIVVVVEVVIILILINSIVYNMLIIVDGVILLIINHPCFNILFVSRIEIMWNNYLYVTVLVWCNYIL